MDKDKYAIAFAEAMDAKEVRGNELAPMLDVTPSFISQVRVGRRKLPVELASSAGAFLEVNPATISEAYDRLHQSGVVAASDARAGVGHVRLSILPGFEATTNGVRQIILPEFLVRREVGQRPIEHLRWANNPSNVLAPEYKADALLLVDSQVSSRDAVVDGAIYAFLLRGRPSVRRILLRKKHWILTGASGSRTDEDLDARDLGQLEVRGLVVGAC